MTSIEFNRLLACTRYHFEGSLPQYDVVCKERLIRPEDPANSSAQLALQVAAQVIFLLEIGNGCRKGVCHMFDRLGISRALILGNELYLLHIYGFIASAICIK